MKSDVQPQTRLPQHKNTPLRPRRRRLSIACATTPRSAASRIGYAVQTARVDKGETVADDIADGVEMRDDDHRQHDERADVDQAVDVEPANTVAADDEARQPDGRPRRRRRARGIGHRHVAHWPPDPPEEVVDGVGAGGQRYSDCDPLPGSGVPPAAGAPADQAQRQPRRP